MVKQIALVRGDGSAPEMMDVACPIAIKAAKLDGIDIEFVETPMGWAAYKQLGDTLPRTSFEKALALGTVFFGGVGDPALDDTIGKEKPDQLPEGKCILGLRLGMKLLLNFREMNYRRELGHKEEIRQVWVRFLLEDSYYGNQDLMHLIPEEIRKKLGIMLKKDVTGEEEMVTDLAYYRRETLEKYAREIFKVAKLLGLPVISVDKANIMPRYLFWRKIFTRIGATEFADVPLRHQLVDSGNMLLFTPKKLHAVIACGNEHGDILTDGAAGALGGIGLMASSAVNAETGDGMFESGGGTAHTLAGQNKVNPTGRTLTAAMMLRHIGAVKGAAAIERAVKETLLAGYGTEDMINQTTILGTKEMGDMFLFNLH